MVGPGTTSVRDAPSVRHGRRNRVAYAFVAPLVAVFAVFYLWPAITTLVGSLFRWGLLRPWRITEPGRWDFQGLGNYAQVLSDGRFWGATLNTGLWLVLFPFLVTTVSFAVSVAIWNAPRGPAALRTVFILPMTISLAAAGVIWTFVYDPDFGVLPSVVEALGGPWTLDWGPLRLTTAQWLSDPGVLDLGFAELHLVNLSLIVAGFWAFAGFGVITFTAGLSTVSSELIEAAKVDGARMLQLVRHVLVPVLRGPLVVVLTVSVIFALRTFDIVWVITQGGPAQDTEVLAVLLFKQAFVFLDTPQAGVATAVAILMSAALIAGAARHLRRLAGAAEAR